MSAAVLEQLAAARAHLDAASDVLLSPTPEALERCSAMFESAVCTLARCGAQIADARGHTPALDAARQVRRSFLRAGKLLESAARFHGTWHSIRGAKTGGYTERGEAAPVRHTGRISIEA